MSGANSNKGWRPRRKSSYAPGTVVFSWKFNHPVAGECGGSESDDWSENRGEIEARMKHCQWPSQLIEAVA